MNMAFGIGIDFISIVFGLLLLLFGLRLMMQLFRADFYNPLAQSIVRATRFLDPLRKVLGAQGGLDFATLLAVLLVKLLQIAVISQVVFGMQLGPVLMAATLGISLIANLASFFFYAIIIVVVLSWIAPDGRNPVAQLLWSLTEPVLGPARRLLPPMGGLDLSPILVMFLIHVVRAYLVPILIAATGVPAQLV